MNTDKENSFIVNGKLALPYQYFAGRTGSRFLISLRDEKKIKGIKCEKCNKVYVPPRSTCESCLAEIGDNWVDLSNKGTVTGYTVINYEEPHQPVKPPYILALIKLEGADTAFTHIVQDIPIDQMKNGLTVEAVFADEDTSTIMNIDHFRPV